MPTNMSCSSSAVMANPSFFSADSALRELISSGRRSSSVLAFVILLLFVLVFVLVFVALVLPLDDDDDDDDDVVVVVVVVVVGGARL